MLELKLAKNKMENEEGMNHLLVKVKPEEVKEKVEKPIAFILVVDVSGSMNSYMGNETFGHESSTKLDYVKQASERLIDMMKDGDKLGVVSFSDSASLEYPLVDLQKDERFKLKDRIRALQTRGTTNVSDGLELAYKQIPDELKETHHVKLLLLSDGQANYGITNVDGIATLASEFQKNDVSVSTLGVGVDYNAYYMETIATVSGGMFYHLEKMGQLNDIFTKELETLTTLTTKQAKIKLTLPIGLHIEENLNGFKEDANGVLFLGNVFHEQVVLSEIYTENKIPNGTHDITALLEYHDQHGTKKTIEKTIALKIVNEDDMADVKTNQEVVDMVKQLMAAKVKKEALRNYEIGDFNAATKGIENSKSAMKKLTSSYHIDTEDSLQEMDGLMNSMSMRTIDQNTTKQMYSDSYNITRNVNEDDKI